jgi:hypothetical protein
VALALGEDFDEFGLGHSGRDAFCGVSEQVERCRKR